MTLLDELKYWQTQYELAEKNLDFYQDEMMNYLRIIIELSNHEFVYELEIQCYSNKNLKFFQNLFDQDGSYLESRKISKKQFIRILEEILTN